MNFVKFDNLRLKFQTFISSDCKEIRIRKFEFVAKTQFHFICVLVTGGKDTGLKPRIADLVPGSWAQRSNVLCAGDIMLNLNGKECSNMMQHQIGKYLVSTQTI